MCFRAVLIFPFFITLFEQLCMFKSNTCFSTFFFHDMFSKQSLFLSNCSVGMVLKRWFDLSNRRAEVPQALGRRPPRGPHSGKKQTLCLLDCVLLRMVPVSNAGELSTRSLDLSLQRFFVCILFVCLDVLVLFEHVVSF